MSAGGRKRAQGGAADPGSWAGAGGDAQGVRRRQLVLFSVIAAAVLIVLAAWLTAGGGKGPAPAGGIDAELAGPDVPEKVWTRRSEARIGAIETRLREMQGEARRLAAENERLRGRLVGDAENARGVIDRRRRRSTSWSGACGRTRRPKGRLATRLTSGPRAPRLRVRRARRGRWRPRR